MQGTRAIRASNRAGEPTRVNLRPGGSLDGSCFAARFGTPSSADCSCFYMSELTSKLLHFSKLLQKRLVPFTQNSTRKNLTRTRHHMPQKMTWSKKSTKSERQKLNELKPQLPDAPSTLPLQAVSSFSRVGVRQSVGKATPLHESGGQLPFQPPMFSPNIFFNFALESS